MNNRFIQKSLFYILVSFLLLVVYPLDFYFPTGNQCIYFFWGIKNTGLGFLENDFLASQPDPFPLFSMLVTYSSKLFGNSIFLFWYWIINLLYVVSVFEIAEEVGKQLGFKLNKFFFTALFLFANSTLIWGGFFSHFFNFDLRWVWDSGFAEQGILRGYLQPSVFGVFILISFMFFIKRNFLLAFATAAIASCFHANYFLVSGVFIAVYILILLREKSYKKATTGSLISFLIVLPYLIYVYKNFGSTSPETAEYIRNHIKGHPHFDYLIWMNAKAFLQLLLIVFSLWLIRKSSFFLPLFFSLITLIVLTAFTYFSGNIFLLNITPWRISVVLVPIAVTIITAHISSTNNSKIRNLIFAFVYTIVLSALYFRVFGNISPEYIFKWKIITAVSFVIVTLITFISEKYFKPDFFNKAASVKIIFLLLCLGISGIVLHKKDRKNETELMNFVKENLSQNQQYLIPPEMTDFRVTTGAPVFVDSCIYHSNALSEWDKRMEITNRFFTKTDSVLLDSLVRNCGITHIIARKEIKLIASKEIFSNERYIIFDVNER